MLFQGSPCVLLYQELFYTLLWRTFDSSDVPLSFCRLYRERNSADAFIRSDLHTPTCVFLMHSLPVESFPAESVWLPSRAEMFSLISSKNLWSSLVETHSGSFHCPLFYNSFFLLQLDRWRRPHLLNLHYIGELIKGESKLSRIVNGGESTINMNLQRAVSKIGDTKTDAQNHQLQSLRNILQLL